MASAGEGRLPRKVFDPSKIYDVTAAERQLIEKRAKFRDAMRNEYMKKITNPHRGVGGYVFDPAIQRFLSMRAQHFDQFKPTPKNFAFTFVAVIAPIFYFWYKFDKDKKDLDHKCRTGQIAYKDRDWKFV